MCVFILNVSEFKIVVDQLIDYRPTRMENTEKILFLHGGHFKI